MSQPPKRARSGPKSTRRRTERPAAPPRGTRAAKRREAAALERLPKPRSSAQPEPAEWAPSAPVAKPYQSPGQGPARRREEAPKERAQPPRTRRAEGRTPAAKPSQKPPRRREERAQPPRARRAEGHAPAARPNQGPARRRNERAEPPRTRRADDRTSAARPYQSPAGPRGRRQPEPAAPFPPQRKPQLDEEVVGKVQVHRNGSAHLLASRPGAEEVFIPPHLLGVALPGDEVAVELATPRAGRPAGARREGRVVRVVKRATEQLVGLLQRAGKNAPLTVRPDDSRIGRDVVVRPGRARLASVPRVGEKVVVRLAPWTDPRQDLTGEITEVLGPAHAPGVDMLSIIRKYGLPPEFPEAVLAEAEKISERVPVAEIRRRHDLREKFIITIDPDDARDFDDAIDVEPLLNKRGEPVGWQLGVHIADVSHYVQPGSALDKEALQRGNSTYLADRVIPMLPERLSNGICSLKPGVERLVFSAFITFDAEAKMTGARFGRSVIRSAARLSYRQAFAILQGQQQMPPLSAAMERETRGQATVAEGAPVPVDWQVAEAVRQAWELASRLRRNRFGKGSLDLDFPEVKVWLDGEGHPVRLEKVENDASHQLIEECMLAANEAVAWEIKRRGVPTVYRVHEDPDPDRLEEFRELARNYGIKAGDLAQRGEVQKVLKAIRGTPEEYALKLQFLKSLKRAAYGVHPLGHYGLAKENYTHFTSPIRRYADLVVHRSLERAGAQVAELGAKRATRRAGPQLAAQGSLGPVAIHISETERTSADAEKDSTMLKKMEFFQRQLELKKPDMFQAIVTDVKSFGLIVELPEALVSGVIPVNALNDDYYLFDAARRTYRGRKGKKTYGLGTKLEVIVARVDAYKRSLDFVPA